MLKIDVYPIKKAKMLQDLWKQFLHIAQDEVGSRIVETWFKALTITSWNQHEKVLYLSAPNTFVKDWISNNYITLLEFNLCRLLNVQKLTIVLHDANKKEKVHKQELSLEIAEVDASLLTKKIKKNSALVKQRSKGAYLVTRQSSRNINEKYTFDNFVFAPNNSLAYAAAQAVAEHSGKLYNPLFLYGGSGLGKTHLLHAIGNKLFQEKPHSVVLYQTADRFVQEFISAIRFDKMHNFQKRYQNIDVLLIDDIQFMAKKEQTQEAFFHIFNALHDAHKQIVFTSDTYPHHMNGITERLRSRLGWGLVADVLPPSIETKIAILRKKIEQGGNTTLSNDVMDFIASSTSSNIRELEGSLVRILAIASLKEQEITIELVREMLFSDERSTTTSTELIDFTIIIKHVNKMCQSTLSELRSKKRDKELVLARHIAMYLMKHLTDKSLRDIGSFLGGRDHTSVRYAIEKVATRAQNSPLFRQKVEHIKRAILTY
jgi:chromosomal replication initiator protein